MNEEITVWEDEAEPGAALGRCAVPLPAWMRRNVTKEPMPDVVAVLRRQRAER